MKLVKLKDIFFHHICNSCVHHYLNKVANKTGYVCKGINTKGVKCSTLINFSRVIKRTFAGLAELIGETYTEREDRPSSWEKDDK